MVSPNEYRNKITEMGLDKWGITVSSIQDAKNALNQVRKMQNELWGLKKGIKAEISISWNKYREDVKGSVGDSIVAAFMGKKRSNKIRNKARINLANNRDQLIHAYREVESIIDNLIEQHKANKEQLLSYIREIEAKEETKMVKRTNRYSLRKEAGIDYYEYIKSKAWREKAEEAKARAGNRCQVCNRSRAEVQLDAHHRTYERLGNELPEDITILCRECHQLYEGKKKIYPEVVSKLPKNGFCIRCKKTIKLHPLAPYCYTCFIVWRRFENADYQENYCHICGKETQSTMLKSVCSSCFKEHRNKLQFKKPENT